MKKSKLIVVVLTTLVLSSVRIFGQASEDAKKYNESLKSKFPLTVHNDYQPQEVIDKLFDVVGKRMAADTIKLVGDDTIQMLFNKNKPYVIMHENFRYTYTIWDDKLSVKAELIKKEKLYYRPYTALGCAVFAESMATMVSFSSIDIANDKKLHFLAGGVISIGSGALIYRRTKNKWLSAAGALVAGSAAGLFKEWVDGKTGGVVNNQDAGYTIAGACAGAVTIRFTLHR